MRIIGRSDLKRELISEGGVKQERKRRADATLRDSHNTRTHMNPYMNKQFNGSVIISCISVSLKFTKSAITQMIASRCKTAIILDDTHDIHNTNLKM